MGPTGIVRQIDGLGRVVLPIEFRKVLNINVKDSIEISMIDQSVVIKKYNPSKCVFCGEEKDIIVFKEKNICKKCLKELIK